LVIAATHGEEGGRVVAALWRHPPPQHGHRRRLLSSPEHAGLQCSWVHYFFENRFKGAQA
jgi:hypothetical protein